MALFSLIYKGPKKDGSTASSWNYASRLPGNPEMFPGLSSSPGAQEGIVEGLKTFQIQM